MQQRFAALKAGSIRPIPRHEKYDVLHKPSRATSDR
jgi:hypothetical protein